MYECFEPNEKKDITFYNFTKAFKKMLDDDLFKIASFFLKDLQNNKLTFIDIVRQYTKDQNFIEFRKVIEAIDYWKIQIKTTDLNLMLEELGTLKNALNGEINYVKFNEQLIDYARRKNIPINQQLIDSIPVLIK